MRTWPWCPARRAAASTLLATSSSVIPSLSDCVAASSITTESFAAARIRSSSNWDFTDLTARIAGEASTHSTPSNAAVIRSLTRTGTTSSSSPIRRAGPPAAPRTNAGNCR